MESRCDGQHRIFCAEVIGVESLGKVVVVTICTNCNEVTFTEHQIATPGDAIRLLREEKDKAK
jgi:hypothetical protein